MYGVNGVRSKRVHMAISFKSFVWAACVAGALACGSAQAGPSGFNTLGAQPPHTPTIELIGGRANGTRVKGYTERRGGYSYNQADSINTYGDSRTKFGGATSLRDPELDKQTTAGPFDHGFFFDSGTGARGGDAPYMN